MKLHCRRQWQTLNRPKASLATAQLTYESKEELYKENVVSSFDLSTAKNSLLAAKAQLAQAKHRR